MRSSAEFPVKRPNNPESPMLTSKQAVGSERCSPEIGQASDGALEVLAACDSRYLPHAATMICSLLEHNKVSIIHLFYSQIDPRYLSDLEKMVRGYDSRLVCHEIIADDFKDLRVDKMSSQSSIANYYRLVAPQVLPITTKKILYLDSDMIVRSSLDDLWNIDLGNNALAAVEDAFYSPNHGYAELPPGAPYFNAGMLLINLDYWRRNKIAEQAIEFIRLNPEKANYYDQDALNTVLVGRWICLGATWNAHGDAKLDWPAVRNLDVHNPAIVHFVGNDKPWHWTSQHSYKDEYRYYRSKTPWRDKQEIPFRHLSQEFQMRHPYLWKVARSAVPGAVRQWLLSRL
jgi:UDP-glucose/galactose:(glucosyl)LPS alpha-1,2-glucosyl/galactosyltransferase